jgi:hypothetical protein
MVWPALLNDVSGIGLAGTDEAPVQVGAKAHAGHTPQSAGQVTQLSEAWQTPSPHIAGPDVVLLHEQAAHMLFVHVCIPWVIPHVQACVCPLVQPAKLPPLPPLPVVVPPLDLAHALIVVPPRVRPRTSRVEACLKVFT